MKRHLIISLVIALSVFQVIIAEKPSKDFIFQNWRLTDRFGSVDSIAPDTMHLNFQLFNHIDQHSIANSYRANLGSPIQSKVFYDRPLTSEFIFADAYYPYMSTIESARFYRTNKPFSSLYHLSGGSRFFKDEQIRFLFTFNPNRKLNVGLTLDYLYGRGEYPNLAAKRFAGSFFATYDGERYRSTAHLSTNNHSNFENGGIADTTYINGPITYPTDNIPVNIRGFSNFIHNQLFYNHHYSLGIMRPFRINEDSVRLDFVPVTVFSHTLQVDDMRKRYYEPSVEKNFYENTYLPDPFTNDTSAMLQITNRVAVSMAEEFNKWLRFGLTAFIENEVINYSYMKVADLYAELRSNTRVGGVLSKQQGEIFTYNILGQMTFIGPKAGDFLLNGDLRGHFNLGKQRIQLEARGFTRSDEPSFFMNFYHSNHFRWENNFQKVYRTHLGGIFAIPTLNFNADLSVENVTNFLYFNEKALPEQYQGNIQIISARLDQDFKFGSFVLENKVVYQLSSDQSRLPLPQLTLFHNFYYHDLWFKVLSIQAGVDVRYHTQYFAPSYMPATGQFHVQSDYKIGNYPLMSVYVNAHLKRTRFFAQYYHINQLFMKGNYYSMPLYPLNPATFRMGITWNFYD